MCTGLCVLSRCKLPGRDNRLLRDVKSWKSLAGLFTGRDLAAILAFVANLHLRHWSNCFCSWGLFQAFMRLRGDCDDSSPQRAEKKHQRLIDWCSYLTGFEFELFLLFIFYFLFPCNCWCYDQNSGFCWWCWLFFFSYFPPLFCPLALVGIVLKLQQPIKRLFSCDEDLMCLSHGTNGICLPSLLLSQYSAREKVGGMHLFISS